MKPLFLLTSTLLPLLLVACETMNSNFSCNKTAGDSCLTIEQVDAMTRFADEAKPTLSRGSKLHAEGNRPSNVGTILKPTKDQSVWVAQHVKEQSWV